VQITRVAGGLLSDDYGLATNPLPKEFTIASSLFLEVETLKRNFLYFVLEIGTIVSKDILGLLEGRLPRGQQFVPSVRIEGSENHNPSTSDLFVG